MIKPQIPENEEERLREVLFFNILDTLPEKVYDDITLLAAKICGTPMSLINIIDQDRQWTKSNFGHKNGDMPRELAFCSHTINEESNLMEVPDTREDERFHDNPFSLDDPLIRFYAGATLLSSSGLPMGALCVIDQKPHKLNEDQKEALRALSRQVMSLLELRKKNDELERLKRELEIASGAREMFFSSMSHEIRTPLNSIIGISNILKQSDPREDQVEVLDVLKYSSENLLYLVNDILDLGKINAGKLILENHDFNLRQTLELIVRTFQTKAREKGVELIYNYDEELPEILIGDSNRLSQVFNNLLSNAFKFTAKGFVRLEAKHTGFSNNKVGISFQVRDSGIGIEKDQLANIFEVFTQASHETSRLYGGTGLGLSISRDLVKEMGGNLVVESEVGQGSMFHFTLQLPLGNPQKFDTTHAIPSKNFLDLREYQIRVLVVEDNSANQMVAGRFLKKWGVDYDFADNGQIAVEKVANQMYDLVLMDLHMPVLNGYEAVKAIRTMEGAYFKQVPIIALTASALLDVKGKIEETGMNDFVTKPFKPEELYERLTRYTISEQVLRTVNEISADRFLPILEELAEGDGEFIRELAGLYISNYQELKETVELMIREKQIDTYKNAIHKIKTTNKTLGLVNFEYHLNRIKNRMINYGHEKVNENIALIQTTCDAIIVELKEVQKLKSQV